MCKFLRMFAVALSLVFVFAMLPVLHTPAKAATLYYGYSLLQDAAEREVYDLFLEGIRVMKSNIELPEGSQITQERINAIVTYLVSDHPELFWFSGQYTYQYTQKPAGSIVVSVSPTYQFYYEGESVTTPDERWVRAQKQFNAVVESILDTVPEHTSDYHKATYLYDMLGAHIRYESDPNDQNLYGALVEGVTVCSGYAKAYQYLLQCCGIDAWTVTGDALNSDGARERHRWNVVWLDGDCYYADLTWDDDDERQYHAYFIISGAQMGQNHFMDDLFAAVLTSCNHDAYDYHEQHTGQYSGVGVLYDSDSVYVLAEYFVPVDCYGSELKYKATFRYEGKDFSKWFTSSRHLELAKALGMKNANSTWYYLNNEYQLVITGSKKTHAIVAPERVSLNTNSLSFSFIGQQQAIFADVLPDNASYQLLQYQSSDPAVACVDQYGLITAVGEGIATITVSTKGGIHSVCSVSVDLKENHEHEHLSYVSPSQGNCFTDGIREYYFCSLCSKAFYDTHGLQPVLDMDDLIQKAPGSHNFVWTYDSSDHWLGCNHVNCTTEADGSRGAHVDENADGGCDLCGYHPSSDSVGTDEDNSLWDTAVKVIILSAIVIFSVVLSRMRRK